MKGVVSRGRELDERLKRVIDSHATNLSMPGDSHRDGFEPERNEANPRDIARVRFTSRW